MTVALIFLLISYKFEISFQISNGKPVFNASRYPWMLPILDLKGRIHCGGSLITPKHILTAGHCVCKHNISELIIGLPKGTSASLTSKLTVKSLKCDPKNQPALPFNDLAVVELEESLNRPVIKLVRPEMALVRRMTLTALGWGRDQHQTFDTGKSHLQQVRLKLMNQKKCEDSMHQRLPTMLCTLGHKGKDTCDGDSGGPLILESGNGVESDILIGVINGGAPFPCGKNLYPSLAIDLRSSVAWIEDAIKSS